MLKSKPHVLFTQCRFLRKIGRFSNENNFKAKYGGDLPMISFDEVRTSLMRKKQMLTDEESKQFPTDPDAPIQLDFNPYERADRKCLLCELGIKLDYKNGRLLQQFVSNFSGRVYEQHVTGLCKQQYKNLLGTIAISRKAGYMPVLVKDAKYMRDPRLFDPLKSVRPHSYD